MRVAMPKKTSTALKKCIVFFIVVSSIFREKSSKNHAKRVKPILVHKNRQKITRGTLFFSTKTIFNQFLGSARIPRGLPGRAGKIPKSLISLIHGQLRLKTTVDGLWEASGRPRRCLQAPPRDDFWIHFARQKQTKNAKSVENNSKKLEELVTLIRATMNS